MKKTLKILTIIISLVLTLIILTGCGNENTINNEDANNSEKTVEVSRGQWQDNVYSNDFAKLKFNLPEGWNYSSDEEIAALMNVGAEALNEDQQKLAELAEQMSLYDMVANDPSTGASVMVMFEKTTLKVNTDFYINQLKTNLEAVTTMEYEIGDTTTQKVGGEEYTVLTTKVPAYNMVQKYYIKQEGNYFIDILVTYLEGSVELENIMSNFQ